MKFVATLIVIVIGAVYYPLNLLYIRVQKWYLPMWKKDKIIYFAFAPFYWTLFIIVFMLSYPYEKISAFAGH